METQITLSETETQKSESERLLGWVSEQNHRKLCYKHYLVEYLIENTENCFECLETLDVNIKNFVKNIIALSVLMETQNHKKVNQKHYWVECLDENTENWIRNTTGLSVRM